MKINNLTKMTGVLMLLCLQGVSGAEACEHHKHMAAQSVASADLPDQSLYQLSSKWTDQNGKEQNLSDLAGKPRLMVMIFTRCQTACPLLVSDLKAIEKQLSEDERSRIDVDLFSFDSKRENPSTLKEFAEKYKIDQKRWSVMTSNSSSVSELAAVLGVQYKELDSGDFIHANVIFLVNPKGEVVAKREGLRSDEKAFVESIRKAIVADPKSPEKH